MAAVSSAVPSAVPGILTVDTTPDQRSAQPAEYGYPASGPAKTVPDQGNTDTEKIAVPDGETVEYAPEGSGPWPGKTTLWGLRAQGPVDRGEGFPQVTDEAYLANPQAPGPWSSEEDLQTYDYVYQSTDTEGWEQNVTNDRTSYRNTFGQANPENNPTWYPYSENVVPQVTAFLASGYTADESEDGVYGFSNGALPEWDIGGSTGNTAYETPGAPATTSVTQAQASNDYDPGEAYA